MDVASEKSLNAILRHSRWETYQWNDVEDIFLHLPKTAGTAIDLQLRALNPERHAVVDSYTAILRWLDDGRPPPKSVRLNHVSPEVLVRSGAVEERRLRDRRVFTVFRNPVERFFSAFHYATSRGHIPPETTPLELLRRLQILGSRHPPFVSKSVGVAFFRPQVEFFAGLDVSEMSILRFDDLIAGRTGLPFSFDRPVNPTDYRQTARTLFDPEKEVFETIFRADLALWDQLNS